MSGDCQVEMAFVCKMGELQNGDVRRVDFDDRPPIAVFNVEGKLYAIDDTCTHGNASLSEGYVEGCVVECPFHAGTFDICTGKALAYPAVDPVKSYPVNVDGDDVFVVVGGEQRERARVSGERCNDD